MRNRRLLFCLILTILVSAAPLTVHSYDCWRVANSMPVNDWRAGAGWCAGWWYADCSYCWTSEGNGGSCSTTLYTCSPHQEYQN